MNVRVYTLTNIWGVAEVAAFTQGTLVLPTFTTLSHGKWLRWLKSEHSPIRALQLRIHIYDIPYYVHVHLVRHHVGCQFYVRSQRPDCINPVDYDRRAARQDTPVDVILDANVQALINISRRRLCYKADETTREVWETVRVAIASHGNPYVSAIAKVMLPNCQYQDQCHELKPCGRR